MANLRANKIYGTSGPDANGSALFNGTDYLTASNAAAFRLNQGSGADFTIEAWIYAKSVGTQFTIASLYHTTGNKRSYNLYVNTDAELKINYSGNGTAANTSVLNAGVIPTNEWIHVAVTHDTSATTLRLFKNGLLKDDDTGAHATWYANTDGDFVVGSSLDGFISNLHINKGTCKYTASFDPYKQPIEVETNTSVLCCNSSTDALNDDKSNTFVQTASDGVKPASDTPFSISDAGVVFDGDIKMNSQGVMYFPTGTTEQRGGYSGRMIVGGGEINSPGVTNVIEYLNFAHFSNAVDFGDLTVARRKLASCSSSTRGIWAGGATPGVTDVIDYVTISNTGNAADFGNLLSNSDDSSQCFGGSNNTRGVFAGGYNDVNVIQYITIASTGNATDFGDLLAKRFDHGACASPTRLVVAGGKDTPGSPDTLSSIEYVTIATTGNGTNFGDLAATLRGPSGLSNNIRGLMGGGTPASNNTIQYITIATSGNAADFGDLHQGRQETLAGGTSNNTRGCWAGGQAPAYTTKVDMVMIANQGNAVDFGNLTTGTSGAGSLSDSHGGLS